jgi:glycine oxidase
MTKIGRRRYIFIDGSAVYFFCAGITSPSHQVILMTSASTHSESPIVIIGGGIIGLSLGWQLLRRGREVTIIERGTTGREASWAAGGLLAPHAEVGFEEEDFLRVGVRSLRLYPRFVDELAEDTGEKVPLDSRGTLIVGFNRDDTERIRRLYEFRKYLELPVEWLAGSEVREIEPILSPRVTAAISIPDDTQVNSRRLVDALKDAFLKRGGKLSENTPVTSIDIDGERAVGVSTATGKVVSDCVVLAAGCWSAHIDGVPEPLRPPVRPVKGQLISLRLSDEVTFGHIIRSPDIYIVPKDDGRLIVGASQEEKGFDKTPTAGEVMRMLERGWEAVPSIYDLPIESIDVGLRPGSRDHMPIVGASPIDSLYYATGHFRHGILLAPVTAYEMSGLIVDGTMAEDFLPFDPSRFAAK